MSFFWTCNKHVEREILEVAREQLRILRRIEHALHPHPRTTKIAVDFGATMNDLVLTVGQSSTATIVPLEADGVTITPGATVSAQGFTLSDPSLTLTQNPDGTATITGVSASTGPVTGTAVATVTDSGGGVGNFSQTFTVTVKAASTGTTQIGVSFSTPA